ncbi:MAG TPA: rod shape-determining protein RodA [Ignavibacteria bacterium]|nr:rod shape-determining protein RodA [Ignavibacteria bacterium]
MTDFFKRFDIVLLLISISIVTVGLVAIYSATYTGESASTYFSRQFLFAGISVVVLIIVTYLPPKTLAKFSYYFYGLSLLLLILVLFFGKKISGQKSWFSVGGFGIQPSEFAKLTTIMALASFLSNDENENKLSNLKNFIIAIAIIAMPVILIMRQPDMGTALVFLSFIIPVFFWAGLSPYWIIAIISPVIIALAAFFGDIYFYIAIALLGLGLVLFKQRYIVTAVIVLINIGVGFGTEYAYEKLAPYQQKRIMAVFDPTTDPLGSGYNVIQSKVAIGSGGFFGKGFLQGTQTQLKFIPEQWTDFIFCMIGEEFGFLGAFIIILLYCILIFKLINNAYLCKNRFLGICCIGFASIFLFHLFINIGMTIGLMPVIGIPLPLVSYGISSLLSFMIMIGIAMNAYRNRNIYI